MIYLKQSTASQEVLLGPFVDSTDGNTAETGLTIANTDIKIHKAGATTLANKNSGGATHISGGNYYAVFDATDTDTLGSGCIVVQVAGALAVRVDFVVLAANVYDALIGGGDLLDVNVSQFGNANGTFASGRPETNLTHIAGAAVSTSTAQLGVNVVNFGGSAGAFASGRPEVNTSHVGGSAISQASGVINANVAQISGDTTAADNLETAFDDTAGAVPWQGIIDQGTAQSATSTTVVLRSAAAFADDTLIGATIMVFGSTQGYWQTREITDSVLSTDTVTVDAWTVTPSGTITYKILAGPPAPSTPQAVNVTHFGGSAGTFSGGRPEVNTSHLAGSAVSQSGGLINANVTQISSDATAADNLEAALDGTGGVTISANLNGYAELRTTGGSAGTNADELVDLVWDEILSGSAHNTASSAGRRLRELSGAIVESGTAQAGGTASITLASAASSTDGTYDPAIVRITGGTGIGQARMIIHYVGSTRVASVDRDWRVAPDNTSVYEIVASQNLISTNEGLAQGGGASTITLNSLASATDNVYVGQTVVLRTGTGQDQARIITGYVGSTKVATVATPWEVQPAAGTGYIIWPLGRARVTSMESNTLTAAALATDAVTEIQSGLATAAALDAVDNFVDTEVSAIKAVTDKLDTALELDVSVYRFTTNALENAPAGGGGGSGDWTTGEKEQIRHRLGIDGTATAPSATPSLATAAALDTVDNFLDTEIAAIKAKTDNLPTDPADASDIASSFSTVNTTLATISGYLDTEVAAIKAKTDNLPASPAATGDIPSAATIADAVWDEQVDGTVTARQSVRLANSVLGGELSGGGTGTEVVRDLADTKARLTYTVDDDGNRTAVTRDLS